MKAAQRLAFNYLINEGKAVFVISNAKLDDEAKYTLTARNKAGEASTSAKLRVKQVPTVDDTSYVNPDVFQQFELKKKPTQPDSDDQVTNARIKIIDPLKDFYLVEGTQAVFACKIDAYPKPEVVWLKDGKPLMASQRYETNYDYYTGIATLVIKTAFYDDKGNYECVATNIAGTDRSSANLIVKFVPNVDDTSYINPDALRHLEPVNLNALPDENPDEKYKKPYFVKVPKDMEVREGAVVRLDCLAFGRPNPELTWYFNGKELKDPKIKVI